MHAPHKQAIFSSKDFSYLPYSYKKFQNTKNTNGQNIPLYTSGSFPDQNQIISKSISRSQLVNKFVNSPSIDSYKLLNQRDDKMCHMSESENINFQDKVYLQNYFQVIKNSSIDIDELSEI